MDTQEARIYAAIIISAIVIGVIIIYFVGSVVRQQRRNLALQQELMMTEIATLEKERARTAADLHDELGPLLSAIRFRVDHAKIDPADLEIASSQLDDAILRLREIANNLMPAALQRKGLVIAVTEYIGHIRETGRLKIAFDSPPEIKLEPHVQIHVYRVIQEAVLNCIRHAAATEMTVRLQVREYYLSILCRDNGKGFDTSKVQEKGIGLNSLKNRTEFMGGTMQIESKPQTGTALLFEIPVKD
jgi:two-component system, NarL family, sensor kinase